MSMRLSLPRLLLGGLVVTLRLAAQSSNGCVVPQEVEAQRPGKPATAFENIAGAWFAKHGQLPCAITSFESALKQEPNSLEAHYNLGLALLEDRQLPKAEKQFRLLIQRLPKKAEPHLGLGMVLEETGDLTGAEREFRTVLSLNPEFIPAMRHLGDVLIQQKRYTA